MQNSPATHIDAMDQGLRAHMVSVYAVLGWGLGLTAATAYATLTSPLLDMLVTPEGGLSGLGWVALIAPLGLLIAAMFGLFGRSANGVRALFWAFALLQGPGMALLVSNYTGASVVNAAAATAATFGAASLYGYSTGRSLASMGSFMFMGVIGLIAASLINLMLGSPALDWAISCIAVIVFTGLAAWETQSIKQGYDAIGSQDEATYARYMGALGLFISIINIFSALLNLTGSRD